MAIITFIQNQLTFSLTHFFLMISQRNDISICAPYLNSAKIHRKHATFCSTLLFAQMMSNSGRTESESQELFFFALAVLVQNVERESSLKTSASLQKALIFAALLLLFKRVKSAIDSCCLVGNIRDNFCLGRGGIFVEKS